jgi:hypothetical protein
MKQLPIQYPIMTSYNNYATLCATISCMEDGNKWIYNNFSQLYAVNIAGGNRIIFRDDINSFWKISPQKFFHYHNPFFSEYTIIENFDLFFGLSDLVGIIKHSLDNGFYVNIMLAKCFIEGLDSWGKLYHDACVYGYDDDCFFIADFIGPDGSYSFGRVSFAKLIESYRMYDEYKKYKNFHVPDFTTHNRRLIMYKLENIQYAFDVPFLLQALNDYYTSQNTIDAYEFRKVNMQQNGGPLIYGMDLYEKVLLNWGDVFALRNICSFLDHKLIMAKRCRFLVENNYINDLSICSMSEGIYKRFQLMRTIFLKNEISPNLRNAQKMEDILRETMATEKLLIQTLTDELVNHLKAM